MTIRKALAAGALATLIGGGMVAASTAPADAYTRCNSYGRCWNVGGDYDRGDYRYHRGDYDRSGYDWRWRHYHRWHDYDRYRHDHDYYHHDYDRY